MKLVKFSLLSYFLFAHSNLSVQQHCSPKVTCDDCIRTYGCVWCSNPSYQDKRCQREWDATCSPESIINPQMSSEILEQLPLTEAKANSVSSATEGQNRHENIVQISPQRISLKLRPNEGHAKTIDVHYRQAEDYPVDLYYLMDLSNSMNDDKDKLSKLGDHLADTMSKMTSKFRLGFGSFVDKVVMPFVDITPKRLKAPCSGCAPPYGFKNVMPLSNDTSQFAGQVKSALVSGNLDAPEGGFDAIMQAVVCGEKIGWRERARKLLVFSTDSSFHFAGDGKLGGIIKPNDGCCHLDEDGYYAYSSIQDYPSVSQINYKVKEHSINMIFAVTYEQIKLYERLSKFIEGSSFGTLSNDSSNVVELVRDQYRKIRSAVEMRVRDLSNHLRLTFRSKCLDEEGSLIETNKCDGLKVGQTVKFEIDIELISCPSNSSEWRQQFSIYPVGVNENISIDVEMLCDCKCSDTLQENSPKCSHQGSLKCGICECAPGFSGDDCSCVGESDKNDNCLHNKTGTICSGRGDCVCNKCRCHSSSATEVFWGDLCECNNFTCSRTGGKLCAGHGSCVCGVCQCDPEWIDEGCTCENSITNCLNADGEICSGHGVCVCNKCFCNADEGYVGTVCDKCLKCPSRCNELKGCVDCKVHKSGSLSKEECDKCDYRMDIVDKLEVGDQDLFCSHQDENDCRVTYIYEPIEKKKLKITAQRHRQCPPQAYILGVVFTVVSSIVLIGLALLIVWRCLTSLRDRREYAKFEKERMLAKWDTGQNPIYIQATSTFRNPLYNGKS